MTIEEEFFNAFGIEPEIEFWCKRYDKTGIADCNSIKNAEKECIKCENGYIKRTYYPKITDRKYLELYCIQKIYLDRYIYSTCVKNLKEELLQVLINYKEIKEAYTQTDKEFLEFTNKVKALFEEEQ